MFFFSCVIALEPCAIDHTVVWGDMHCFLVLLKLGMKFYCLTVPCRTAHHQFFCPEHTAMSHICPFFLNLWSHRQRLNGKVLAVWTNIQSILLLLHVWEGQKGDPCTSPILTSLSTAVVCTLAQYLSMEHTFVCPFLFVCLTTSLWESHHRIQYTIHVVHLYIVQ